VERRFAFMEVNTRLQVEHPITELTTGLDLVKLQIQVARGERLQGDPPPQTGHAIELRLNAEDPDNAFAPAPGLVEVFRIPTGPGVRVDTGVEEGDQVAPQFDSMIAKIMAYGRTRDEALARLQRVLAGASIALRDGMSNKGFLLHLLDNPDVRAARYDIGYIDRLVSQGRHTTTRHAEIALIQAAIEAYGSEVAVDRARFFALAARGRPEVDGETGRTIDLRYRGNGYKVEVFRLGATEFHVRVDGRRIVVRTEPRGPFERRLHIGGQGFRVFTLVHGTTHWVKVNGMPHRIFLDQGGAVRSPAPAVVVSVAVGEGERVAVGDRLVVLEAMKMELAVHADFAGTVREVAVHNNVQVTTGTPLLFIEPDAAEEAAQHGDRLAFDHLAPAAAPGDLHAACKRNLDEVRSLMLGYDVDPADLRRLLSERGMFCEGLPADDPVMLACEDEVLTIFADVASLFARRRAEDEAGDDARRSAEDYLFTYLRDPDARGHNLPTAFVEQLRRVLAHFGVRSLDRTPELEESLYRIASAHRRMDQQVTAVLSILERRRAQVHLLGSLLQEPFRALLDRIAAVTQGHLPTLHDAAREVRYRFFSQPLLGDARRRAYREAEWNLAYLEQQPDGEERDERIAALVACPQPLKSLLSSRFHIAEARVQRILLEVMMRRYYRIRDLCNVQSTSIGDHCFVTADYEHEGKRIHVVTTHAGHESLAETTGVCARMIERYPAADDVVVDVYVWKPEALGDEDATAAEFRRILSASSALRQLRRVVVSVSTPDTVLAVGGTRHFTFRPSPSGYWEENRPGGVLHRGLHPMMAKRLELWRLANFEVERLPSSEDIYLFRAVARDNAADERFVGIAEIRDLTPVRDDAGRVIHLPHLERMFSEVLEEMRHAQGGRPARQRLFWNRVLLYVWPPLTLRSDEFAALVRRLEPLTEGLGLESVMVHVKLRHPRTEALRETVVTLWNVAGGGFGVRFDDPATEAIRPLGTYEQKVLSLKRRGLPSTRPAAWATWPSRSAGSSTPPWPWLPTWASRGVVRRLLRCADLHGVRHREHGLDRADPAPDHRVHPGGRRDQHRRDRHQRRRPAVLERRGHDADAHPRDPDHDPGQLDGAHRQAGARLLRRGVGRRQLRHRRLRAGDGAQRPGAVLGAVAGRRLRAAAAPLRVHLREARRAVPAPDRRPPTREPRRAPYPHARPGLRLHGGGRRLLRGEEPGAQEALRRALGDAAVTDQDCEPLERWERWRGGENSVVWDARVGGSASACWAWSPAHPPARVRAGRRPAVVDVGHAVPAGLAQDRPRGDLGQRQPATGRAGEPVRVRRLTGVDAALAAGVRRGDRACRDQLQGPDRLRRDLAVPRWCVRGVLQGAEPADGGVAVEGSYASVIGGAPAAAATSSPGRSAAAWRPTPRVVVAAKKLLAGSTGAEATERSGAAGRDHRAGALGEAR
jgi:biotin carboxyl carrier protein